MILFDGNRKDIPEALIGLGKRHNLHTFVETGTLKGDTVDKVKDHFDQVLSIELDEGLCKLAEVRFSGNPNVRLFHGASGDVLPIMLKEQGITSALFWLDAHGNEYDLSSEDQVPKELAAIEQYAPNSIVVIDDVIRHGDRLMVNNTYPMNVPEFWVPVHFPEMQILVLCPR